MIQAMYAGEVSGCPVKQFCLMLPPPVVVSSKFQSLASEAGLLGCHTPAGGYMAGCPVLVGRGAGHFQTPVGAAVCLALGRHATGEVVELAAHDRVAETC